MTDFQRKAKLSEDFSVTKAKVLVCAFWTWVEHDAEEVSEIAKFSYERIYQEV